MYYDDDYILLDQRGLLDFYIETTVCGKTRRSTRAYYPGSELIALCLYSLMMRSCVYLYHTYCLIISYTYPTPIATKIFNYTNVLQDLNIDDLKYKLSDHPCRNCHFMYNPAGKAPKCRDFKSINWKHNLKLLWISSRIMSDNRQNVKRGHIYSFRMDLECKNLDTTYN